MPSNDQTIQNDEVQYAEPEGPVETVSATTQAPSPFGGTQRRESVNWLKFNGKEGVFTMRVSPATPGAIVINTEVGTHHELRSDSLRGATFKGISARDDEYNGVKRTDILLRFGFDNGAMDSIVSFNSATYQAAKVLACINSDLADLTKPFEFRANLLRAGDKPPTFTEPVKKDLVILNVFQDGKIVRPTQEIPPPKVVKVGNKEVSDTSERDQFVIDQANALIAKLEAMSNPSIATSAKPSM